LLTKHRDPGPPSERHPVEWRRLWCPRMWAGIAPLCARLAGSSHPWFGYPQRHCPRPLPRLRLLLIVIRLRHSKPLCWMRALFECRTIVRWEGSAASRVVWPQPEEGCATNVLADSHLPAVSLDKARCSTNGASATSRRRSRCRMDRPGSAAQSTECGSSSC
jgi:hypothetical protein